jgi:hypothetical protein
VITGCGCERRPRVPFSATATVLPWSEATDDCVPDGGETHQVPFIRSADFTRTVGLATRCVFVLARR